ncbi:GNAT family N-acetyltransferase [Paenibacillus xanthanilyticus]|uniref:GNAT family N-acetyltransferase n=1 Tax=Paenibacillus xanthanilyticus TaxID=1783531 RepID=A0ABV8KBS2_9BACL
MSPYSLIERLPTPSEHLFLWEAVGWGSVDPETAASSIARSLYGVVVLHEDQVVGMGRIVGDGVMYFYIQDVAVLPDHQKHGLGKMIVERLMVHIRQCRLKNGAPFVGLFASQGKEPFYEQFGFKNHAPGMTGMFTVIDA